MKSVLACLALFMGLAATSAHAADKASGFLWKHFNAAPYAASKDVGMETRTQAFECMGLPAEVVAALTAATEKSGDSSVHLMKGDHLDKMVSKTKKGVCVSHDDVTVAFDNPTKGIEYAATAEKWVVTVGDTEYTVIRPDVCNNWSVRMRKLPPPPKPAPVVAVDDCRWVYVGHMPYGSEVHFTMAARRPLPPSACSRKIWMVNEGGHGKYHACSFCDFTESISQLRAKGYMLLEQPGTKGSVTCVSPQGCDMVMQLGPTVSERKDDDIFLFCLVYPDGSRTYVKDIHWYSYRDSWAYIVDDPDGSQVAGKMKSQFAEWHAKGGLPHIWKQVDGVPPEYRRADYQQ